MSSSAAGTPSTDPWVIVARERSRYEEQFKSLKPINGIITGEQAKGFFLQSQLPPLILGQIWALADTDGDGKMDINEFSIACKLINLKLRGFEVPKGLPPSLLASLKGSTPPAIPPLPNPALVSAPPRPEPPKAAPLMNQPLIPNLGGPILGTQLPTVSSIQSSIASGVIPSAMVTSSGISASMIPSMQPLQTNLPHMSQMQTNISQTHTSMAQLQTSSTPLLQSGIQQLQTSVTALQTSVAPLQTNVNLIQTSAPLMQTGMPMMQSGVSMQAPMSSVQSLVSGVGPLPPLPVTSTPQPLGVIQPPLGAAFGTPLVSGVQPLASSTPLPANIPPVSSLQGIASVATSNIPSLGATAPVASITSTSIMGSSVSNTPRASITSLDRAGSVESPQVDWAVPHQTKLKYTQVFNTTDRTRTGYLTGMQARNVMVQSKLPQNILAQIWALSDMDADGRLGCEEFVLAMHLCEQAALGHLPPTKLPLELIPPSFRRAVRTTSISSQGSVPSEQDPAAILMQTSFEDKRKENFEKGQAELERRRKTLLDQQRKEAEERERKEREEQERQEKARQEAERKRLEELEKQMREQQEQERLKEEERKRQAEQREAARREMERQRQLEWEKQRLQELQQQRQREQENVLKLKAKNQSLTIELSSLNEQVKELSQKICDTRVGVTNVKATIDGMRSTRDAQMQEMSQLKNKLKEQNAKLLALSQEKVKLEAKNKHVHLNGQDNEQARLAFENKEITIKNLREKIEDMQKEIDGKLSDIENNNSQLAGLKTEVNSLINECENLYNIYETKRDKVLELKNSSRKIDYSNAWKNEDTWAEDKTEESNEWPVSNNWNTSISQSIDESSREPESGMVRYRALYEFVARNNDELSFQPGDIINVPLKQTAEPGWLAGELRGHTGWFPEAYVELINASGDGNFAPVIGQADLISAADDSKRLEGIAEVPENSLEITEPQPAQPVAIPTEAEGEEEYYIANYPYQSQEQGDLTFNAGEIITVIKKDGDWWTGKIGTNVGIFPSNYVQKVDMNSSTNAANEQPALTTTTTAPPPATTAENTNAQTDNEVSQINENKSVEKPLDSSVTANAQVVKSKKPEIASVIAPYQATSSEQLSLARGQLIMIRKKTDSGWWEGELQAKGRKRQVGWFPASYVKVLNSSGRASGRSTPVSTTRMQQEVIIDKVIALYPYTAANPDELSFAKDDIISVTAREEEAWWRGELNGVSGLFPSNYVAPLQQQQSGKRYECIKELIQTEEAYVRDMMLVHDVFEIPLRKSRMISRKDIENIFVNWLDILDCNKALLKDLKERINAGSDVIGDILCDHLPEMTAYITFCVKQLDSADLLQKLMNGSLVFQDFVKRCQKNPAIKGMPLSSFLIKPMQRITKYPLLISKIMEYTPEDHEDRHYLEEALKKAERFLSCVNENVRLKENHERLLWLQTYVQNDLNIVFNSNTKKLGSRKLLHFGLLTKVKSGKELIGFLFNDFFMLAQPSRSIGSQFTFQVNLNISFKMYKKPILIQELSLNRGSADDNTEYGTDANRILKIHDNKTKNTINLLVPSINECTLWTKQIEAAKEKYAKIESIENSRPKIIIRHGLRLNVIILEAYEIRSKFENIKSKSDSLSRKNKGKSHTENIYCEVQLGTQVQKTPIAVDNLLNGNISQNGVPQIPVLVWNHSMQFQLKNINEENIIFTVYELCSFSPDEFLGRADLKVLDIFNELNKTNGPITKTLILHQVESGEIVVRLDLYMFNNN